MAKKLTAAAHARRIHAREPALGPSEIARRISKLVRAPVSRQQVAAALAVTGAKAGRPLADHVTVRVKVPRARVPGTVTIAVDAQGGARVTGEPGAGVE